MEGYVTTEKFTKVEFETALTEMSKSGGKLWECVSFEKYELCYIVPVLDNGKPTNKRIFIRSSIGATLVAADTGKNSIRIWAEYEYCGQWRPLAKVQKHHVARTVNWRKNLKEWISATYRVALEDGRTRVHGLKQAAGMTTTTNQVETRKSIVGNIQFVKCPKCGASMRLKTPRPGQNWKPFYGCGSYPRCKHTMRIAEHDAILKADNVDSDDDATEADDKPFIPSHFQVTFRDFIQNETGNCVLVAGPGTGKSTTALWALDFIPRHLKTAYVAFNRDIVDEFSERAPGHVQVCTLNSLGNGNLRRAHRGARFNQYKVRNILTDLVERDIISRVLTVTERAIVETNTGAIHRIVDLLKANLFNPTAENIEQVCDKYGVELNGDTDLLTEYAIETFVESVTSIPVVYDYSDQIYASARQMIPTTKFDVLICDEAQDMTVAQIHMALNSLTSAGRFFAVGDPQQSIYGFRGADTQSIQNIVKLTSATVLPLMLSYRLPRSHVEIINKRFGTDLESPDWAIDGVWRDDMSQEEIAGMLQEKDAVLCRCNAPLVPMAFGLIRRGIKAVILGRDIGENLVNIVKKIRKRADTGNLSEFVHELTKYQVSQVAKLERQKKAARAQALEDKCETILAISEEGCDTIDDLITSINVIFTNKKAGVIFSSIHKAKGGEWDRVFIIKAKLLPHPKAVSEWQLEQENHIEFVAKTRSKGEMYISWS